MTTQNLIIELGTEELPPKALKKLASAFADSFARDIAAAGLPCGEIKWYAAPRRLAVSIKDLEERQPDQIVEKKGPAVTAAFKDGEPTKAAIGWAASNGITVDQAERFKTDKGEWLLFKAEVKGKAVLDRMRLWKTCAGKFNLVKELVEGRFEEAVLEKYLCSLFNG